MHDKHNNLIREFIKIIAVNQGNFIYENCTNLHFNCYKWNTQSAIILTVRCSQLMQTAAQVLN